MYATAVCLLISFNSEIKLVRLWSYSVHHVKLVTWCIFLTLPWLPTQEAGHIPEESNQDTVHKDVMLAPLQDIGSEKTCGNLLHNPIQGPPHWRWDVPQTCGKLEAWHPIQNPRMLFLPLNQPNMMLLRRSEKAQPIPNLQLLPNFTSDELI